MKADVRQNNLFGRTCSFQVVFFELPCLFQKNRLKCSVYNLKSRKKTTYSVIDEEKRSRFIIIN